MKKAYLSSMIANFEVVTIENRLLHVLLNYSLFTWLMQNAPNPEKTNK